MTEWPNGFQCLFEPRVIEFDQKRAGMRPIVHPDVTEDIVEQLSDHFVSSCFLMVASHDI